MTWRNINTDTYLYPFEKARTMVVFDTETTGLGKDAKIIQFSGIKYARTLNSLVPIEQIDFYINPQEPLKEKITEITGITDYVLAKARTEEVEAPGIFEFLESADLWVAYNIGFDVRMLHQMSQRTGIPFNEKPCLDVLEMARDFVKKEDCGDHKLGTMIHYFWPDKSFQFHSSLDDVRATALLLTKFISMCKNYTYDDTDKVQAKVIWASYWVNPNNSSQTRIKLNLSIGEYGDVFWDCISNAWSHKTGSKPKKLFQTLDLRNLEEQILRRYGRTYGASSMSELASKWGKQKRLAKSGT